MNLITGGKFELPEEIDFDDDQRRTHCRLWTDGGIDAEPNQPEGEGGIGALLCASSGAVITRTSAPIGWVLDHHIAEYMALIAGLTSARSRGIRKLVVFSDSGVMCGHVNRQTRVKPLYLDYLLDVFLLQRTFDRVDLFQIPRRHNYAHKLADEALGRGRRSDTASR